MYPFIKNELQIGSLRLPNRLIQGPLAGFSCSPFRELFYQFTPPAYTVTEMISAHDILHRHLGNSRYLHRSPVEKRLCYQISGNDPHLMAQAALRLQQHGADLVDINCGCPKAKIRKKGAGSVLIERPQHLETIVNAVRQAITIPLTVKLRIQGDHSDLELAQLLENAGADALIIHGRRWTENYEISSNLTQIASIKKQVKIPVIANGDIAEAQSLQKAISESACDAYMISRAGTGKPWLYECLLDNQAFPEDFEHQKALFMQHLHGLASLEGEYKAVLQSRTLLRYYFGKQFNTPLQTFYSLERLIDIEKQLVTS